MYTLAVPFLYGTVGTLRRAFLLPKNQQTNQNPAKKHPPQVATKQ
jgi:hypothetical protein